MKNIFEKILYGVKVANDNIIVLNEKIDAIAKLLSYDEGESTDAQANKKTTAFWKLAKLDYLCASDGVNHMYKDLKREPEVCDQALLFLQFLSHSCPKNKQKKISYYYILL